MIPRMLLIIQMLISWMHFWLCISPDHGLLALDMFLFVCAFLFSSSLAFLSAFHWMCLLCHILALVLGCGFFYLMYPLSSSDKILLPIKIIIIIIKLMNLNLPTYVYACLIRKSSLCTCITRIHGSLQLILNFCNTNL